jgi:hypothetical protein
LLSKNKTTRSFLLKKVNKLLFKISKKITFLKSDPKDNFLKDINYLKEKEIFFFNKRLKLETLVDLRKVKPKKWCDLVKKIFKYKKKCILKMQEEILVLSKTRKRSFLIEKYSFLNKRLHINYSVVSNILASNKLFRLTSNLRKQRYLFKVKNCILNKRLVKFNKVLSKIFVKEKSSYMYGSLIQKKLNVLGKSSKFALKISFRKKLLNNFFKSNTFNLDRFYIKSLKMKNFFLVLVTNSLKYIFKNFKEIFISNNVYFNLFYKGLITYYKFYFFLSQHTFFLFKKNLVKIISYSYNLSFTYKVFLSNLINFNNIFKKINYKGAFLFSKIKFKLKKLALEKVLFKSVGKKSIVYFRNILKVIKLKNRLRVPTYCRMWWLRKVFYFKDFLYILYFSVYFHTSKLLATFVANNINDRKKHYRLLKTLKKIMRYFFIYERPKNFFGIYLAVHGKFHGILRKRNFKVKFGRAGVRKFNLLVDYNLQKKFTRFGVFSIKVWLIYLNI